MTPSALPGWRPRKTLIDLYNEKNDTPWYYRLAATLSAMMLAVGLFIFSSTIVQSYHSTATPTPSLVSALVLVILAYAIFAFIFTFSKSWIFQLEILCVPHLSSDIIGLISIIYALSIHDGALSAASTSAQFAISALVLSIASIVVYSIISFLVFRKIYIVRARDAMYRSAPQSAATGPLREDEEQRQQLSRLLLQQDEKGAMTPGSATQTTFKLEWPGHSKAPSRQSSLSLSKFKRDFADIIDTDGNRRGSMPEPSGPLPGNIQRLPSIRVQEPSGLSSWFNTSRNTSDFDPPTDHLTGGIERVPTIDQQQPSATPTQISMSADTGPAPLRPVAYVSQPQSARYFGMGLESPTQPGTPQSALPSYSAYAHPSMNVSTRPLSRFGQNGFPIEKKEPEVCALPAPVQQRPIREGPYRMADQG